jgi:hypothetical protein
MEGAPLFSKRLDATWLKDVSGDAEQAATALALVEVAFKHDEHPASGRT